SGYWAANADDTELHSACGFPRLIRNVNPGLWAHSPHVHCNHGYVICEDGVVQENVILQDTWSIRPMQRVDVLWPFIKPPDIPQPTWDQIAQADWADPATHNQEMALLEELYPGEHCFMYPMHCHQEVTQTAAGGNYPQGLMAHLSITGV